jgi:hypothetical protein
MICFTAIVKRKGKIVPWPNTMPCIHTGGNEVKLQVFLNLESDPDDRPVSFAAALPLEKQTTVPTEQ